MHQIKAIIFLLGFLTFSVAPSLALVFDQEIQSVAVIEEENCKNKLELKDYRLSDQGFGVNMVDFRDGEEHHFKYNTQFSSIYLDPKSPPPRLI